MADSPVAVARVRGRFDPARLFDRLPASTHRFLLESGPQGPSEVRRWSFLGSRPFAVFTAQAGAVRLRLTDEEHLMPGDPFQTLDGLMAQWRLAPTGGLPPFSGGLVGYFAYDSGRLIERLPETARNDAPLPDIYLCAYDAVLAIDHELDEAWVIAAPLPGRREDALSLANELGRLLADGEASASDEAAQVAPEPPPATVRSNFDRASYCETVDRARAYILAGDIFEVNLSQRLQAPLSLAPRLLYERLRTVSPAPFSGFLDAGGFQVLSSSPERFLKVDENRRVETRPIKGTRPRARDPQEDERLAADLLHSVKDEAELNMIVDLARNDLGRACQIGTVEVQTTRRLERYANVHQAVAVVEGELMPQVTLGDLLRATLPGGSITGAPKIRAMEIIEELEGIRRNAYCGAMGYLGFTGQVDLNILIRTMVCAAGSVTFGVGGAVVLDSDPNAEYEETLARRARCCGHWAPCVHEPQRNNRRCRNQKAPDGRTIAGGTGGVEMSRQGHGSGSTRPAEPLVWVATPTSGGQFVPAGACAVPLDDRGLRYGDALFETMRVDRGGLPFAARHLARLREGLAFLGFPDIELTDQMILSACREIARRNGVHSGFLRLTASRAGGPRGFAPPAEASWRLIAEAGPMDDLSGMPAAVTCVLAPWRQDAAYPGSRVKSSSALDKVLAMRHAEALGADECLFMNESGHLVEGTRANVFVVAGGELLTPDLASGPLPGIARGLVLERAARHGLKVREAKIPEDLAADAQELFLTSALRGIVPVRALAGRSYAGAPGPVTRQVARLFELALAEAAEDQSPHIS